MAGQLQAGHSGSTVAWRARLDRTNGLYRRRAPRKLPTKLPNIHRRLKPRRLPLPREPKPLAIPIDRSDLEWPMVPDSPYHSPSSSPSLECLQPGELRIQNELKQAARPISPILPAAPLPPPCEVPVRCLQTQVQLAHIGVSLPLCIEPTPKFNWRGAPDNAIGKRLWPAAQFLVQYLVEERIRGTRVVELGSGA